jgi:hypothetical protein
MPPAGTHRFGSEGVRDVKAFRFIVGESVWPSPLPASWSARLGLFLMAAALGLLALKASVPPIGLTTQLLAQGEKDAPGKQQPGLQPGPKLEAGKPPVRLDVWSVAISRDGKFVAAGTGWWDQPGEIGIWDLTTRKALKRFPEELGVASVAFSPDGSLLASGSWTGHLRLFDWSAGRQVADFPVAGVARVAFSPDGTLLGSATEAKTVQLWDVAERKLLADLEGDLFRFHYVTFTPDGKRVLAGGGEWKAGGLSQVTVWDVESRKQVQKLVGHGHSVLCIACSPDGKTIATGSVDRTIRLWDSNSGKERKTLRGHAGWVESLAFTADSKRLVSGCTDRTIRFWDVDQGTETSRIDTMMAEVRAVRLTPDGTRLIAGGAHKTLKIYDLASHEELGILLGGPELAGVDMDNVPPQAAKQETKSGGSLLAVIIVGLVLLVVLLLSAWFRRRSRRRQVKAAGTLGPGEPDHLHAAPGPIAFVCPGCGKRLKAQSAWAGKKLRCPQCDQAVLVPGASSDTSPASP